MDLQERLNHLERHQDWAGLVEELENGLVSESQSATKAAYHLRLARVLESKFLQSARALKHYQEAFKLNPALTEALEEARLIYWGLAKLNMVQKLLELELKSAQDPMRSSELLVTLGDVLVDQGEHEQAMATYARALGASEGQNEDARALLEDVQCDEQSWQERVAELLRGAHAAEDSAARASLFLRAARIATRFAPEAVEDMLGQAYSADHSNPGIAALYEAKLVDSGREEALAGIQREFLSGLPQAERGEVALRFGTRWLSKHQNSELGAEMLAAAFAADATNLTSFSLLRELWGEKEGNWDRLVPIVEKAITEVADEQVRAILLAEAALLAWHKVGNLILARSYFERLSAIDPDHPNIQAFELQIGERLEQSAREEGAAADESSNAVEASTLSEEAVGEPALEQEAVAAVEEAEEVAAPAEEAAESSEEVAEAIEEAVEAEAADDDEIRELRELVASQESARRYNELVRTLVRLAEAVPNPAEKVDIYLRAADLYTTRFANQAEAIKAYEAILDIDPEHLQANDVLRQMYERRRDWEKLLGLQRREAERLEPGPERASIFLDMAKLATERVRKPDVCIDLWKEVLASEPEQPDAIGSLAFLYERTKDYEALAQILEKQAEITYEVPQKLQTLSKLAVLYGDRLGNDEGAVNAWRALLAIEPNDRRAQEALKRRYLALGWWDELELFYAESGKWDELIRLLEAQESRESEAEVKVGLLLKIAQLWAERRERADRASRSYEKILELDPNHLAAAEALVEIYTAANNHKGLASAIEVKLLHEQDAWSQLTLLRELAELYGSRLRDPGAAFDRYLKAFELAPEEEQCAEDLERLGEETERWEEVAGAYRNAVAQAREAEDESLATALRLKLGRILATRLERVEEALEELRAVYDVEPDNREALEALEGLYRQTSQFGKLLEIYEKKRELTLDPAERREILYAIAGLFETELEDPKKAIESYQAVLEDEPQDEQALQALDNLYQSQEDYESYVDILRRRLELDVSDTDLIDLKLRLGNSLENHLDDAPGALECYREILALEQGHEGARVALEALLQNADLRGEAARILEGVYEVQGDWEKLVGVLDILADAGEDPAERVERRRKIARIAITSLDDLERAFRAEAQALSDDPSLSEIIDELERLAEDANLWEELVSVFEQVAGEIVDPFLAREYWTRLSALDERLGRIDQAAKRLERILAQDPTDEAALLAMDALYRRAERFDDVVGVFRRRIEHAGETPAIREQLYAEMAELYEDKLGRPDEAIAAYREVLALDDTSEVAITALDGLFTRQSMWIELADNLEAQLRLATTEEAELALMLRLAELRESQMGQPAEAIEGFREVLERDPTNEGAVSALERLGAQPEHELAIAQILEPLYRQSGDYAKLVGVHEVQIRHAEEGARQVELLHEIARLQEEAAGDSAAAFDTFSRALRIDPSSELTQEEIERLARATARFADLASVYEELAAASQEDPQLAGRLFAMSARVYRDDLGDFESAIGHYRQVLSIDPLSLDAAKALEDLFRRAERYSDLSTILQRKADIVDDPFEQKEALYQAAQIEEDLLGHKDPAISVYLKALEIDPEDIRSLDSLIRLYLELSRWQDLLVVYTKKADLVFDVFEKKSILYQVGAVYERELGDVDKAIDSYAQVLELDPDDATALGRLDALYQTTENWPELLSVLTHQQELCDDPNEAIALFYRIAELYEQKLDDIPRAIELYREILTRDPAHGPTLAALENLKSGERDPLSAASVLEPIYESAGDWERLISVIEVQQGFIDDPLSKVDLLHRIARLYEENVGNVEAAFDVYARAIRIDSGNEEALGQFERLAGLVDKWADVAAAYKQELERLTDEPHEVVDLGLRAAQIFEVQLEERDEAIRHYRRVLEADPDNYTAIRSLDRLLTITERWEELIPILAREAEMGETPDEILELKYRLGQVQELRLGNVEAAIGAYNEVLAAAPEHERALEALERLFAAGTKRNEIAEIIEPLYQAAGEWEKLMRVYEAQLQGLEDGEARAAMFYRIAEIAEDRLFNVDTALEVYIRAAKEMPLEERVSEEAERLAGTVDGGWELLANAYADVLGLHETVEVQRSTGAKLARIFEEELGDVQKAEETYRYVLGVDPLDSGALANLDRIYSSLEEWAELASVLEQRVKVAREEYELVDFYARLGKIYEERLEQSDDAIRVYRKIFDELDKAHEDAIEALARIYAHKEAWQELDAVYERQLENAMGDVQEAEIRAKVAYLAADRLGDSARAIETWKRVLDLRGEDPEALRALANLYEAGDSWAELCDVLERELDISLDEEVRVDVLNRRARIFLEKLGRDDQALDDYQRVVDIDYANLTALRAIADIWRGRDDANEVVQTLHLIVDRAAAMLDASELTAIYRELGTTYNQKLEQPHDAADAWAKLLEVDPSDFEAMAALETIYRTLEQWPDVVDVKMGRVEAFEDAAEKVRELLEVAAIWRDEAEDPDAGTTAYEKILAIEPAHDGAFAALESLHVEAERWEPLIELYLARLDTREAVEERTKLLRDIARVFDEKLDDRDQAFDALVNAFAENYDDNETVRYLDKVAQATNRWNELIQAANEWLKAETDASSQIQLCLRLAKWYGEDLGHPEYAQPYYGQILQLDPNNVAVLRQMASLYRKNAQWQQMGATLTRALEVAQNDDDRKEILTDLGDLLDTHMREPDQALGYYHRALELDPHHLPALEALEKIYTSRQQNRDLVSVLERKVEALEGDERLASQKLRIAALYEKELDEPQRAIDLYREVLDHDASSLAAMRGLERLYERTQAWPELVSILEAQLDVISTEREEIDALMKLAGIQEEQFLKPDLAAQRLEQVLEIDMTQEQAFVALARCYRKMRQWLDLIETYERHVAYAGDKEQRIELYTQIATVYADEVDDADRAIDAYRNVVDIDETNIPALEALSKLYAKQGDAVQAIDWMGRVADLTTDRQQRVEMYYRIGKALDEELGDRLEAEERFEMALDLEPTHLPSLAALRRIAMDAEDWDRAARYLDKEQQHTELPRQRSKLLVELGKVRHDMLGEPALATEAFELALECDLDNEEAAYPLVIEYVNGEKWEKAEPLADMLVKKAGRRERGEQHQLWFMLGEIASALGKDEKALKAFGEAHKVDVTDQKTIRGLADISFRMKDWATALTNYQKVLTSLDEAEFEARADVYYRLGCIRREQSQAKQAIGHFEKALGIQPGHRPSLDALVDIYMELGDYAEACAYKRQILDDILDGKERLTLLIDLGEVWADKAKSTEEAVSAFEEALDLEPESHAVLHRLLQLYQQSSDWEKLVDTLRRIADLESNPERKSKYVYAAAQIYRDKIEDLESAVEHFNEALDLNPLYLEAFERINKILTRARDWKQLERSFRRMLHRVAGKGNTELEHNLWHNLGLIYRDRLNDLQPAVEAFTMATRVKPDDMMGRQILAELYESTGETERAIEEQQEILRRDPMRAEPYRALYRLYVEKQAYDEAWCICAALSFLQKADADERRYFEEHRPEGMAQVKSRLDNELWGKHLFYQPEENLYIGKIFEMLAPAALMAKIQQLRSVKQLPTLDKRFRQDPANSTVTFAKTFGWAAQVLGVNAPELYVRSDVPGGLAAVPATPPASVAGQGVLTGFTPQELTFICGKHLSSYRGEHYLKNLFPTVPELTMLLFAGMRMVEPNTPTPAEIAPQVNATATELAKFMKPMQIEGLRMVVRRFIEDGARANVRRFSQAVELTGARAGLVLAGDLDIAKKILLAEPQIPGDLPPAEKMKELILFSVSEDYFALRRALGISIG